MDQTKGVIKGSVFTRKDIKTTPGSILLVAIAFLAGGFLSISFPLPLKPEINDTIFISSQDLSQKGEVVVMVPKLFMAYQDYMGTIDKRISGGDVATIEATVVSLSISSKCPYNEELCGIDPYPNDSGIIQIDRVIDYSHYDKPGLFKRGIENQDSSIPGEESEAGLILAELQSGDVIDSFFLLSARPAKQGKAVVSAKNGIMTVELPELFFDGSGERSNLADKVVDYRLPGERMFLPILKKEDYFIFITEVLYLENGEGRDEGLATGNILPGLKQGDSFLAEIYYDGTAHIEKYSKL